MRPFEPQVTQPATTRRFPSALAGFGSWMLAGLFMLMAANPLHGQEDETLESLQQQWTELAKQFDVKAEAMQAADANLPQLRTEYQELLDRSAKLIGRIETRALADLEADRADSKAIRALLGLMVNYAQEKNDAKVLLLGDKLIAKGVNPEYFKIATRSSRLAIEDKEIFDELLIRQAEALANDLPRVKLVTTQGEIVLELFENEAPNTVANFISLVEQGYYENKLFHRVLEGFMAQGGGYELDAESKSEKKVDVGYTIACECESPERRLHFSGSLSMAHAGRDTGNSQFFLTFVRPTTPKLDGKLPPDPEKPGHTVFGRLIEGHRVLDLIQRTEVNREPLTRILKDKIISATVLRKRDHEYKPEKLGDETETEAKTEETESEEAKAAGDKTTEEPESGGGEKAETEKTETEKAESGKTESDGGLSASVGHNGILPPSSTKQLATLSHVRMS